MAGNSITRWGRRAPLWQLFLFCGIFFGGLTWLWPPHESVGAAAIGGVLFGLFMTGWIALQRRRDRASSKVDTGSIADLDRAIKQGTLPADPALRAAMARLVQRRRQQMGWVRIFSPVVFGLALLLSIFLVVIQGPWPYLLCVAFFAGCCVLGVVEPIVIRRRLDRMSAVLDEES